MATKAELDWLKTMVPAAQKAQARWQVPAAITLAQCILESSTPAKGWGQSELALKANNYFGVKASHLNAPETYEEFPTDEYVSGKKVLVEALFEKYFDADDSFDDHGSLLHNAKRYRYAMLHTASPDDFASCLQEAGYSTSPSYAQTLIELMRDYDLYQYDSPPPTGPAQAQEVAA
jgi:flagellum-specific peptidoglycan hydrolase FlgJ